MTITEAELQTRLARARKILKAERAMRERVFARDAAKRAAKVAEIDDCLATLAWLGNALTATDLIAPSPYQAPLLLEDAP